jgi:hypothetical protein
MVEGRSGRRFELDDRPRGVSAGDPTIGEGLLQRLIADGRRVAMVPGAS